MLCPGRLLQAASVSCMKSNSYSVLFFKLIQVLHTSRINLSPFTKDFRVCGTVLESESYLFWSSSSIEDYSLSWVNEITLKIGLLVIYQT